MRISDWSSDVCSSDLRVREQEAGYYAFGPSLTDSTERTLSVSPRVSGQAEWLVAQHWVAGVDYTRTHYDSDTFYGAEEYQRSVRALSAQDSLALTGSTWLTLGARHEWVRTTKENEIGRAHD